MGDLTTKRPRRRRRGRRHDPANPSHYCWKTGCREPACVEARNRYLREWRARRRDLEVAAARARDTIDNGIPG